MAGKGLRVESNGNIQRKQDYRPLGVRAARSTGIGGAQAWED